jgi:DNA modification methylase
MLYQGDNYKLYCGDCLDVLKELEENSVDSIVTDPPYELGFMNKKWDNTGIAYNVDLWKECLRVLKPGGHLLAFGGTRTYHRMACAIEDAGFEIKDCIQWLHSMGFPKSMDLSKAIDKKLGAEREVIKTVKGMGKQNPEWNGTAKGRKENYYKPEYQLTAPATPEAKQWDGWGTALKPANEPIVLARKSISEQTIAENVLKWGTGGLNIDGCRIPTDDNLNGGGYSKNYKGSSFLAYDGKLDYKQPTGRFPANVILDEEAGRMLDEQSGITTNTRHMSYKRSGGEFINGIPSQPEKGWFKKETGGASRFFYIAKASKKERGEGNNHPTVKPVKLMEYLITLITPPNGIVLDPFMGSGTTGISALNLGRVFIGIEKEEQYIEIAQKRIAGANQQVAGTSEQGVLLF